MNAVPPLTFAAVDAMAFAPLAQSYAPAFRPALLGPLVEIAFLVEQERLGTADIGRVAAGS